MSIYLKVAGWNVLRVAAVRSVIEESRNMVKLRGLHSRSAFLNMQTPSHPSP